MRLLHSKVDGSIGLRALGLGAITSSLILVGCAVQVDGDESVDSVRQPFSFWVGGAKETTVTNTWVIDSDPSHTCFVKDIAGRYAPSSSNVRTGVSISGGQMTLRTELNHNIRAGFLCLNATGVTSTVNYVCEGGGACAETVIAADTATRQCYFTRIETSPFTLSSGDPFESFNDRVQIVKSNGNWVFTGQTAGGRIEASAKCMDVDPDSSWSESAGSGQTEEKPLVTSAGGRVCLLQGVKGAFLSDDTTNGLKIHRLDSDNTWYLKVVDAKTGWARCSS